MDPPNDSQRRSQPSYVLDIPSHEIRVDRYIVPIPAEEGSSGTVKRGETLERAWREVNGGLRGGGNAEGAAREVCGHISRSGSDVVLWVFSDVVAKTIELDGLECTESKTIDMRKLVTCSSHGHDLQCLTYDRKCDVKLTMGDMKDDWDMYARAVWDQMLWKQGKRVNGDSGCDLWPISSDKMVLIPRPEYPLPTPVSDLTVSISLLHPLNLAAVHVGPYAPSDAEIHSLQRTIHDNLGSAYDNSTSLPGSEIDSLLGYEQPAWGIYWVFEDLKTDARVESLKGKLGVMTIWPTHLVTSAPPSDRGKTEIRMVDAPKTRTFPVSQDIMDLSLGFYDFMAAYEAPIESTEEITPETSGAIDSPSIPPDQDGTENTPSDALANTQAAENVIDGLAGSPVGSDMDDLFGDHSPTPPIGDEWGQQLAVQSFDLDVEMVSPPTRQDLRDSPVGGDSTDTIDRREGTVEGPMEGALVTEDDFAFFDSPNQKTHDSLDIEDSKPNDAAPEDTQPLIESETDINGTSTDIGSSSADLVPVSEQTAASDTQPDALSAPSPASAREVPIAPPTPPEEVEEQDVGRASVKEDAKPPRPAFKKKVTFANSVTTSPEPPEPIEIVPSPFGPLDIEPTVSSFAYSLPTPAASPESASSPTQLRSDLLARLQQSLKDTHKVSYAAEWDLGSDEVSDMETEEDLSGAPPTPVSFADSDTIPTVLPTPMTESRGENEQIRWEDLSLIGPEWVGTRWDEGAPEGSGRVWKDSWAKGKVQSKVDVTSPLRLEDCDEERLISDLIMDRHLRELVLVPSKSGPSHLIGTAGDSIIGNKSEDVQSSPLAQTQIHVGYQGNVCQVSITSLRYWHQLGLRPVGGPKDIHALAVCTPEPGSVRTAKEFLKTTGDAYEASQLGKQTLGDAAAAKEGIIAVPIAGFVASIAALLPSLAENTVIYAILPLVPADTLSALVSKLLSTTVPTSGTAFVKLIPPSAIDVHEATSIAMEVYDKLVRPIRPIQLRGLPMEISDSHSIAQYPAWTIAETAPIRPELTLNWPLRSYDVMNRWRMVHAAYTVDLTAKRAVAYVIDDQGEGWATKTIRIGVSGIGGVVEILWGFFKEFAMRCSAEYRLIICATSSISRTESEAWKVLTDASKLPASLLLAEYSDGKNTPYIPRNPVPIPPTTFIDPSMRLQDDSLSGTLSVLPRLPIRILPESDLIIPKYAFTISVDGSSTGRYHVIYHSSPDRMSGLGIKAEEKEAEPEEDVVQVLGGAYYRLTCLGRMRHGMDDGPVHVEAVRIGLCGLQMVK